MRVNILGINVNTYTMAETVERIRSAVEERTKLRIVTANPEIIFASYRDERLKKMINSADIVTADGIGVVWAAKHLGTPVRERVTGIDLVQALFPEANKGNWRIFLLGGKPGVAELAIEKVAPNYPNIIWDVMHGYFNHQDEVGLLEKIRQFCPDLLLVGMGAPHQEYWIAGHPGLATVSIGVGGSFDALSGTVLRAPECVREHHLEWLYRLWKEPWRWKRQTVLPRFVLRVIVQGILKK
jgi:N-acetylglucosaminyldiphosphoundecaprenol N-acetyl-beta-D-mannosaminyltransferase